MSDKETVVCWACNEIVPKTADICPNCDMPLKESTDEIEDIDSLLDDLSIKTEKTSESDKQDFDMPIIPEFNEEMPDIPDFASETLVDEDPDIDVAESLISEQIEEKLELIIEEEEIEKPVSFKIDEKVIEEGFPDLPSFEDDEKHIEDEKEKVISEIGDKISLKSLSTKQMMRIFIPQLTYWSFVFIIISFASITVTNSNFTLNEFTPVDYEIRAELFLFGWVSFIPMGWFYRYKLNQYEVKDSINYGFLYLILQLVYLGIVTIIFFLIVNPEAQIATISDTDTAITTIMSTYAYFSFLGFLISGLTFGFFLFFVGYKFYFKQIYGITPASKLSN